MGRGSEPSRHRVGGSRWHPRGADGGAGIPVGSAAWRHRRSRGRGGRGEAQRGGRAGEGNARRVGGSRWAAGGQAGSCAPRDRGRGGAGCWSRRRRLAAPRWETRDAGRPGMPSWLAWHWGGVVAPQHRKDSALPGGRSRCPASAASLLLLARSFLGRLLPKTSPARGGQPLLRAPSLPPLPRTTRSGPKGTGAGAACGKKTRGGPPAAGLFLRPASSQEGPPRAARWRGFPRGAPGSRRGASAPDPFRCSPGDPARPSPPHSDAARSQVPRPGALLPRLPPSRVRVPESRRR